MAKKKRKKTISRGRRIALAACAALLAGLLALFGAAALNADVVRVRRARVAVPDLPPAFEGRTLLYLCDLDLCGRNTAQKSAALMSRLQELAPDLLVLGGDYTSESVWDRLNRAQDGGFSEASRRARTDFFRLIKDFRAPLGKFAVAAPEDADLPDLANAMAEGGVRLLSGDAAEVTLDGAALWIEGYADRVRDAGAAFLRGDCVIAAAWSPSAFPMMVTSEAKDGGPWADMVLSGHTHGGQINLFGRSVLSLSAQEQQFPAGWSLQNGVPVLVSSGVGCEGANLRLGSAPEAWLIVLTAGSEAAE